MLQPLNLIRYNKFLYTFFKARRIGNIMYIFWPRDLSIRRLSAHPAIPFTIINIQKLSKANGAIIARPAPLPAIIDLRDFIEEFFILWKSVNGETKELGGKAIKRDFDYKHPKWSNYVVADSKYNKIGELYIDIKQQD